MQLYVVKQRSLGKTGLTVSEIGLGTWQLGGDFGPVTEAEAERILAAAVEHGVTFFDTADIYGRGLSEEYIGRFLKKRRKGVTVATKVGRFSDPGWPQNYSLEVFRRHTEQSLKRLGVDILDLTQIHSLPSEYLYRGEMFKWLEILKREGKIRHYGVSVATVEEGLFCVRQPGVAAVQVIFNIFRQKPAEKFFALAQANGVALIIRLPVASGLLTGKITKERVFVPQDHRNYNRDGQAFNVGETFAGLPLETGIQLVEELMPLVPAGMTMAQMALRWILDFDAVSVVIPGATRPEQVATNAAASLLSPLSSQLHKTIAEFYRNRVQQHIRGKY